MASALSIRDTLPLTAWPAMREFLAATYGPGYALRDRQLFEWQFGDRADPDRTTVICAWHADALVGMLGYLPLTQHWGDATRPVVGAWVANWMVDARFRNGVGALLMRRLQERFPLLLGQGANAVNQLIAERMGFRVYDSIPRRIAVMSPERSASFLTLDADPAILPPTWIGQRPPAGARPFGADSDTDAYQPDWSRYPALQFGTRRDRDYLAWRYFAHPNFRYEGLIAGPASTPALCIYRVESSRGAVLGRVGRILEFFHPEGEEGAACGAMALGAALTAMRDAGCAFADFYCSAPMFGQTADVVGMTLATELPLATRLNPVEARARHQNLEVWAARDLSPLPDLCRYYVTKADGDQDRPN